MRLLNSIPYTIVLLLLGTNCMAQHDVSKFFGLSKVNAKVLVLKDTTIKYIKEIDDSQYYTYPTTRKYKDSELVETEIMALNFLKNKCFSVTLMMIPNKEMNNYVKFLNKTFVQVEEYKWKDYERRVRWELRTPKGETMSIDGHEVILDNFFQLLASPF